MTLQAYFTPESPAEALDLKAAHGSDLLVIAGGTVLMQQIHDGRIFPARAMGLRRAGLDGVSANGALTLGAAATMTAVARAPDLPPILNQAAASVGGWAIRNMATVGGNLFNQPPYGDFTTALLALETTLTISRRGGERRVGLDQFLAGGRVLDETELITALEVAHPAGRTVYRKFGRRQSNAPTIVTVAAQIGLDADGRVELARIALGGAQNVTCRSAAAEDALLGLPFNERTIAAAAQAAAQAADPVTDPIATAWYRRRMIDVQLRQALSSLLDEAGA